MGKQPVIWKEYSAEDWLKELRESMDRCTGRRDITEILLKTALNTIQSINQLINPNLKFDENGRKVIPKGKKHWGKGEFTRYEQYLFFPQCF